MSAQTIESLLEGRRKNILIVDDSAGIRALLTKLFKDMGFNVYVAADGLEALEHLYQETIPLIVCDWEMPGMDGVELCQEVRRRFVDERLYFIVLTANTGSDAIKILFEAGADDYLTKPVNITELKARILGGLRQIAWSDDLKWFNHELEEKNRKLDLAYAKIREDLVAAEALQKQYIPESYHHVDNVSFGGVFLPAFHTAGDIFNYCRLPNDEVAVFSVDVSGHGVASSLLAVTVAETLSFQEERKSILLEEIDGEMVVREPHLVVEELNRRFSNSSTDHYFTITYGIFNRHHCTLRYCQAGHPPFLVISEAGKARIEGEGGMPVGMFDLATYATAECALAPGDRVFFFSDGIPESEDVSGEQFGEEKMGEVLGAQRNAPLQTAIEELVEGVRKWQSNPQFNDDVSVVGFEVPA